MGKKSKQQAGISNQMISSIVDDVFKRRGINTNEVIIPKEKKQEIKKMVNDLNKQVNAFVKSENKKTKKSKDK